MAIFRVGQRVKVAEDLMWPFAQFAGVETFITGPAFNYGAQVAYPIACYEHGAVAEVLIPLTPPDQQADRFIESLKKLAREPMPLERVS